MTGVFGGQLDLVLNLIVLFRVLLPIKQNKKDRNSIKKLLDWPMKTTVLHAEKPLDDHVTLKALSFKDKMDAVNLSRSTCAL